jgi:hypothetical protein
MQEKKRWDGLEWPRAVSERLTACAAMRKAWVAGLVVFLVLVRNTRPPEISR